MRTISLACVILLTFLWQVTELYACLITYQFKIFPIGIYKDQIITVDVQIRRSSQNNSEDIRSKAWNLRTYISAYDSMQNLQISTLHKTAYVTGETYDEKLLQVYQLAYKEILKKYPHIDLFKPEYISFCDFQKKCDLLSVTHNSSSLYDNIIFENKNYPIPIIQDTSYFAFKGTSYHSGNSDAFFISSVRIYKTSTKDLVVAHLETGYEVHMGLIKDRENEQTHEDGQIILPEEHKPNIEFNDIANAVYQEPLLHHGYGFDIFIVNQK